MYVSLPQGGHYVNFAYCKLTKVQTRGNPTKPTETTFSQLFRNETNPSPK